MPDQTKYSGSAQRLFFPEEGIDLPFAVANKPGQVLITLDARALTDAALIDARSYRWVHGVRGRVVVDVSHMAMINSSCCGWLVNLMRMAKPAPLGIVGANSRVAETLHLMRLDALMKVEG